MKIQVPEFKLGQRVMVNAPAYKGRGVIGHVSATGKSLYIDEQLVHLQDDELVVDVTPWIGSWKKGYYHCNTWRYPIRSITIISEDDSDSGTCAWGHAPHEHAIYGCTPPKRTSVLDAGEPDWEKCQLCGERYPDVYWADDAQWAQVVGDTFAGLRCPECFKREAWAKGLKPTLTFLAPPLTDAGESEEETNDERI